VLVGRKPSDECFEDARRDIQQLVEWSHSAGKIRESLDSPSSSPTTPSISYRCVPDIWEPGALDSILSEKSSDTTCLIHTAGPYADRSPTVLDACIDWKIPVYVDVSDPLDFLDASKERHGKAVAAGTTAVLAAGAFPGLSNLLALEAAEGAGASQLSDDRDESSPTSTSTKVRDVRFNYFTKGLGGSGTINLYITNLGFGDPIVAHEQGKRTRFDDLSGRLLGTVDFFLDDATVESRSNNADADADDNSSWKRENARAKRRVGTQKVFAWPFPEAATVASSLDIEGSSSSAMGTAPEIWNDMLGLLVDLVPRKWWRSPRFSLFLADFSEPLVLATDWAMQKWSSVAKTKNEEDYYDGEERNGECGETHAMRVDVVTTTEDFATSGESSSSMVSIVQCHDSFRRCVGQSCAEFALDILSDATRNGGVYLPEDRYRKSSDRKRILPRMVSTPGTFCYTGPVPVVPETVTEDVEGGLEPSDRILLKSTPTPGLLCNGAPIEVRLVAEGDGDEEDGEDRGSESAPNQQQRLPVYPREVREIVQSLESQRL